MFESGNYKRRKRMRRHTYKPGIYKGWLGESLGVYRNYPTSLYSPWGVKTELGGYGAAPLSSYTSSLQSSLSHIPSLPSSLNPSYPQYSPVSTTSSSLHSFRIEETGGTDSRVHYNMYSQY